MKTDALIDMLARGPVEVRRISFSRRYGLVLASGAALALVSVAYGLGLHSVSVMGALWFWTKVAFAAGVLAPACWLAVRLGRPDASIGWAPVAILVPFALLWVGALFQLVMAARDERLDMWLGITWPECPFVIALLALPTFAGLLWTMRQLAPTRLRLAGAAAGVTSGALAALIYALHCPETTAAFVGTWYVLGILMPTALGALIGPRALRW